MSDITTDGGPVTYQPNLRWRSPEYILRATNGGTLQDGDATYDADTRCFMVRNNGEWEELRPIEPEPPAPEIEPVPCPGCKGRGWTEYIENVGGTTCEMCMGRAILTPEQVYTIARLVVGAKATIGGHNIEIGPETARSYLGYAATTIDCQCPDVDTNEGSWRADDVADSYEDEA